MKCVRTTGKLKVWSVGNIRKADPSRHERPTNEDLFVGTPLYPIDDDSPVR